MYDFLADSGSIKKKRECARGVCSGCKAVRDIVASGKSGKFCQRCYTALERTWAKAMSGPSKVELVDAELGPDGLVPAEKSAKNKIKS